MRRYTLATWIMLAGLAVMSPSAFAAGNDLDITINVVGPNQDVQGAIENHIAIPEGDRKLAPHRSAPEGIGAQPGSSTDTASQLGETGQKAQDSVQQSTQQAQDSAQQSAQQAQDSAQQSTQQAQQAAQDATQGDQ
ncbi:hypothetical protein [Acidihalobacter aeolianus]|nr:hypothetical protein [Acidihalobacter aeolianus]